MNPTLLAYGLLAAMVWTGIIGSTAYYKGRAQCQLEQAAAEREHIESVIDTREKNENDSNQAAAATIKEVEVIRWKTRDVIVKVPVYVSRAGDRGCVVPAGFVRLHDLSASGKGLPDNPDPSGQLYDSPSGIALSTVASTVAENYGTCREEMTRFEGLQDWVTKWCK
jgi:hypothetical protein